MPTRLLNQQQVRELLPMAECIDVMRDALMALARGEGMLPLRQIMWLPERVGALGLMPAYAPHLGVMGLKAVSVFPHNHGTAFDSHIGSVLLYEVQHGQLLAIVDASEITAIRTAAVSAVATHALARSDARVLTIMGTGTQARSHVESMLRVREFSEIRVWSRAPENAQRFAAIESARHHRTIAVMDRAEDAVNGAHVICTTTGAREPILRGEWLSEGAHVNAVGSSVSVARELDSTAVARSALFVDRRESTVNEAGDYLMPLRDGVISESHILGELGDVLLERISGRTSTEQITLFKSLGLALEDVAAAHHVYRKAVAHNVGITFDLGGRRSDD